MFCFLVKVLKGMNILRGFASSSQEVPQIHGLPNSCRLALFFSFSLKTKLHFCIFLEGWACACPCAMLTCGGRSRTCGSQFSPSLMWVPRMSNSGPQGWGESLSYLLSHMASPRTALGPSLASVMCSQSQGFTEARQPLHERGIVHFQSLPGPFALDLHTGFVQEADRIALACPAIQRRYLTL